jgi:hypothetical protein
MEALSATGKLKSSSPSQVNYVYPFFFCVLYGLISNYLLVCVVAGFVLSIIVKELWRPFLPPVLLYFFIFHWAQIFMVVPYMDFTSMMKESAYTLTTISLETDRAQLLVIMSLLQLAVMAVIVGFFLKRTGFVNSFTIKRAVLQLNVNMVLLGFFLCNLVFPFLLMLTRNNPSVNQLIQSASIVQKAFLLLLVYMLLLKKSRVNAIIIVILVGEFLLGFTGYFSDFKEIVLSIMVAYLTVHERIKSSVLFKMVIGVFFLFFVLVFWSYVKPKYREYVNGGSRQQVVVVSKEQSLGYLWNNLKSFDKPSFNTGVAILLERIENMTLYFKVQERVPADIPYAEGDNTMSTIKFLTLPRSLNPNKGTLDPSVKASYYTGIKMATAGEGTSIALGYFTDFFIDFGLYGMIIPLGLVALFIGWAARKIIQSKNNRLFNYSLLIGTVFTMGTMESDLTFFLGAIRNFVVLFIMGNYFIFPLINKFIVRRDVQAA